MAIDADGISINYYQVHLPVDPGTYEIVLDHRREQWPADEEFQALMKSIERLPDRTALMWEGIEARRREIPSIKSQLWSLYQSNPEARSFIQANLAEFNGKKGDAGSFDLLDQLISRQPYRLAWWHGARERMNYRRFFDVSELIGIRVESPEVFEATHAAVLKWVANGNVTGLRVDHVDGLFKPRRPIWKQYVGRCCRLKLQSTYCCLPRRRAARPASRSSKAPPSAPNTGPVKTDHILFIASAAHSVSRQTHRSAARTARPPAHPRGTVAARAHGSATHPLHQPEHNLLQQYSALMDTEGVTLAFADDASTPSPTSPPTSTTASKTSAPDASPPCWKSCSRKSASPRRIVVEAIRVDAAYVKEKVAPFGGSWGSGQEYILFSSEALSFCKKDAAAVPDSSQSAPAAYTYTSPSGSRTRTSYIVLQHIVAPARWGTRLYQIRACRRSTVSHRF